MGVPDEEHRAAAAVWGRGSKQSGQYGEGRAISSMDGSWVARECDVIWWVCGANLEGKGDDGSEKDVTNGLENTCSV